MGPSLSSVAGEGTQGCAYEPDFDSAADHRPQDPAESSDEAAMITGVALPVDGGMTAG